MTWTAEQDAIFARWRTQCPVPAARRDESDWNGSEFNPPVVDTTAPANSIWIRFSSRAVPNSGRPFAIGGGAPKYRQGLLYQQVFYPTGCGEAFVSTVVDACMAIFHRALVASTPQIQCGDTQPPQRADSAAGEFRQINVVTPYEVIEF